MFYVKTTTRWLARNNETLAALGVLWFTAVAYLVVRS